MLGVVNTSACVPELKDRVLRLQHHIWRLRRASSSVMSHSLCTHAVMLTVFNLVSTTPRFHHRFCLRARPLGLTSLLGASSSIPCSFLLRLAFPQKTVFPTCSTPLVVQSPFIGCARLHTTQSFRVWIVRSHAFLPPLFIQAIPQKDSWSLFVPPEEERTRAIIRHTSASWHLV